jgi:DNA-binding transcriptional LysR family regulator
MPLIQALNAAALSFKIIPCSGKPIRVAKSFNSRHTVEAFFHKHNISYVKSMELTSNEAVKQAIIAGLGYSILPLIGIKNELMLNQLDVIDVPKLKLESEWNLVWLKAKSLSPQAKSLLNYIETHKERISMEHFGWISEFEK